MWYISSLITLLMRFCYSNRRYFWSLVSNNASCYHKNEIHQKAAWPINSSVHNLWPQKLNFKHRFIILSCAVKMADYGSSQHVFFDALSNLWSFTNPCFIQTSHKLIKYVTCSFHLILFPLLYPVTVLWTFFQVSNFF